VLALIVYYFVVLPVKELELRRMLLGEVRAAPTNRGGHARRDQGLLSRQLTSGQATGNHRQLVEVTPGFATRLIVLPSNTPGPVIDYGGQQLAFTAGRGEQALANTHEFAVSLAYTGLAFASRCRVEMTPKHAGRHGA
jgi:hypothetical protein